MATSRRCSFARAAKHACVTGSDAAWERCRVVSGDLDDDDALRETLDGCDAAVYLVGVLREDPARGTTFDALQRRGPSAPSTLRERRASIASDG